MLKWYSMVKVATELGMCVNTFKKYYLETYPPDRTFANRKDWTASSLQKMKREILKEEGAI